VRGSVAQYMIPMLLEDAGIYNNPYTTTDNQIKAAIINAIWAYAKTL
jgi:hypothetical protein